MASLLHALNMSTAYVALPNMQGNLSASPDQIGWIITTFVVASAVGTVLTGWMANRIGRRRLFLASIAGFTVTSALCGTATGFNELVIMRALQGFVSAPLLPVSQAIMLDAYPRRRHGFAMSIWSMGMILGPVIGQTVGALLTEWYDWRYLFFLNVPMGLLAFVGVLFTLPDADRERQNLDWIGVISLIIGVVCIQLMLDRGERQDWFESPEIILETILAVLAFYIFVVHCLTYDKPYVNLAIFRDRNFVVGSCLIFVFGIAVFSSLFILPLFLQNCGGAMGMAFSGEEIAGMVAEIPGIQYVKEETSPMGPSISRVLAACGNSIKGVFAGGACRELPRELERGAAGNMSSAALSDIFAEMYDRYVAGDRDGAREIQFRLLTYLNLQSHYGHDLVREVLRRRGIIASTCRRFGANKQMDEQDVEELDYAWEQLQPYCRV